MKICFKNIFLYSFLRLYFRAANPEPQAVISRVETKIFVFIFLRKAKIYFRFSRKSLRKVSKITKICAKTKMYEKTEMGNIVKYLKMSNPDGASKKIGQQ
jgi:hypothetical protein